MREKGVWVGCVVSLAIGLISGGMSRRQNVYPKESQVTPVEVSKVKAIADRDSENKSPPQEEDEDAFPLAESSSDDLAAAERARQILRTFGGGILDTKLIHKILEILARSNPHAALLLADEYTKKGINNCTLAVLHGWSEVDPDGAWGFARENKYKDGRPKELHALASILNSRKQYSDAARLIMSEAPGTLRSGMAGDLAGKWGADSPSDFVTWLNTVPPGDSSRKAMITSYVSALSKTDVDLAMEFAKDGTDDESRPFAVGNVVSTLMDAGRDDDAIAWVSKLPRPEDRAPALKLIAVKISAKDLELAKQIIDTIPKGSSRDMAIAQIGTQSLAGKPSDRFKFSEQMTGATRVTTLTNIAKDWAAKDPTAAAAYVMGSPNISPEERSKILLSIQQ